MVIRFVSRCARKGVDPHPESHTVAALDQQGKVLGHYTAENTTRGLAALRDWLKGYEINKCAVEGANNPFARALSQSLLGQGYRVVDVSPSLTSQYRELGRAGRSYVPTALQRPVPLRARGREDCPVLEQKRT